MPEQQWQVATWVSIPTRDALDFIAADLGTSRSDVIARIIKSALASDLDDLTERLDERTRLKEQLCAAGFHAWGLGIFDVDTGRMEKECGRCGQRERMPDWERFVAANLPRITAALEEAGRP